MLKKWSLFISVALLAIIGLSFVAKANGEEKPQLADVRVVIETTKGNVELQIFASKTPVTAANFLNLAKRGYYNGVTFHRVINNFMVQTGDTTGTGMGIPGYSIKDEFVPGLKHDGPGILSMANVGRPNTNGSQFFITHRATPHLDNKHTVFGKVIKGQDVINAIKQGDSIKKITFIDSPDDVLKAEAKEVEAWDKILDKNKNKSVLPTA